jgi:hypothetical protein
VPSCGEETKIIAAPDAEIFSRHFPFVIPSEVEEWSRREPCDMDKAQRVSDWEIANQSLHG